MKIEIPNLPGVNLPEFEISHRTTDPLAHATGLLHSIEPKKGFFNKKVLLALGVLLLFLLGGRREAPKA